MNPVKMTFKIDLDNDEQVLLAKQFMSDLKGTGVEQAATVKAAVETVRTAPKVEEKVAPAPVTKAAASGVTLDMISKATSEKVQDHRETMKEKLTEMGVARAGELDVEKYQEYYDFLIAL